MLDSMALIGWTINMLSVYVTNADALKEYQQQ